MSDTPETLAYNAHAASRSPEELARMSLDELIEFHKEWARLERAHIASLPKWRLILAEALPGLIALGAVGIMVGICALITYMIIGEKQ